MSFDNDRKVISAGFFPLKAGETSTYSIFHWKDADLPIGLGVFQYSISFETEVKETFKIYYKSEIEYILEGVTTEKVEVLVDKHTLRPLYLTCNLDNISKSIRTVADYKKNKIVLTYWEDGVKDKWVDKIPYRVLDNYQALVVLCALDFENLKKDSFSVVNALSCSVVDVECTLSNIELITTPIGIIECYRICLQVFDPFPFTQYNLFSVKPPHRLIKVIKGPLVYELNGVN